MKLSGNAMDSSSSEMAKTLDEFLKLTHLIVQDVGPEEAPQLGVDLEDVALEAFQLLDPRVDSSKQVSLVKLT